MILSSVRNSLANISSRYRPSATVLYPSPTLLQLLQISIDHRSLKLIQQTHARILSLGCDENTFIITKLISGYAMCNDTSDARLVFSLVRRTNVYIWNTLISGYAKNDAYIEAFDSYNQMSRDGESADDFTLSILSKMSTELGDLGAGESVHGKSIRIGFVSDTVVANSIMSMYCRCRKLSDLHKLFEEMPHRNSGSWNVIISGHAVYGECTSNTLVWKLVKDMQIEGMKPDSFTTSSLLPLCGGGTGKYDYGRELHCYIVKSELDLGLGLDVHIGCCLIDMYSKSNKIIMGRQVFDRMKFRNVFAWTAMIKGYVRIGALDEALLLFREMQTRDGIEPTKVSLVCILPACSSLAELMGGKQIHGFAIRKELSYEVSLCNALIDMYSKCGSLNYARRVFEDGSFCRDAISWSSMISGYGLHGKGLDAIFLYDKMLRLGIKPDMITVVGVLSACGRSGLVNEGLNIYSAVLNEYGIKPTLEICACVVDMFGRSGKLEQALDFIKTMPVEPGPSVWGALVSASVTHGNSKMQDLAYGFLVQVEPENPSNYVSLSNMHASSEKWDIVAEVRTLMKEKGLQKLPGCSWINVNSKTHCFHVADEAHPCSSSIYEMLHELILTMKAAGYSPDLENF